MAFTKWMPFKDFLFLQERMSRVFDEALARYSALEDRSSCAWVPPADIYETTDTIIIKIELAGVSPDSVDLEIRDNVLSLKGERRPARDAKEECYHRMECACGAFQRAFTLPVEVDKERVRANYKDGVLEISVPKGLSGVKHIKVAKK